MNKSHVNYNDFIDDPELWEQFCLAYAMVARLRPQVQYRLAMINSVHTRVWDECIFSDSPYLESWESTLIDAHSNFVSNAMKG